MAGGWDIGSFDGWRLLLVFHAVLAEFAIFLSITVCALVTSSVFNIDGFYNVLLFSTFMTAWRKPVSHALLCFVNSITNNYFRH